MRIIQLLPTLAFGDAVGNDTRAIEAIIQEMGFDTRIYAENIDPRLPKGTALPFSELSGLTDEDVIIYHGSTGTPLSEKLPELPGRKVMIYHNITPPAFFELYSPGAQQLTSYGLKGIKGLANSLDYCIADSDFNKQDLLRMGFTCPIDVCPILIPFSDYEKKPNIKIVDRFGSDGYTNLLFVGRIAPNKKQEDIIRAFYVYHKYYNAKSRLILCGSWNGMETYYQRLVDYAEVLGLSNHVIFTGHVKFDEILAWYHVAHAFVCMSEHEGFCVPLVEAMFFKVPIVAYNCSAVPDTLGGSGLLLETKSPIEAAAAIHLVVSNEAARERIIAQQCDRLEEFSYKMTSDKLKECIRNFSEGTFNRSCRIVQISSTISRGDAVSNDILAFQSVIAEMGFPAPIITEAIPKGLGWETIGTISELDTISEKDIVLYHHATGTRLSNQFINLPGTKVLVYHNVTPPSFFAPYDKEVARNCKWGLENLDNMKSAVDACIAVSEFNKRDLIKAGYKCRIDVCPIIIPFGDYERCADQRIINKYSDDITNIIFVGRCAPNKKIEDVISAFSEYKKRDKEARLILVGSIEKNGKYFKCLQEYISKLAVDDVIFTGHIPFSQILAYYRVADVFLCMSEHEGFCVPLVEAMYFDVPIVAYEAAAVPETMGDSGILLDTKEPKRIADILYTVVHDNQIRNHVLNSQRERLRFFSNDRTRRILRDLMVTYIKE